VRSTVERARGGGVQLLDAVMEEVEAFMHGRKPVDDLTMMTVAHLRPKG
jgi:hypothetical protein